MPHPQIDPVLAAETWLSAGSSVALATVISTWGSAPRPAGSQIAIREDGEFTGSVSGGCVESAVIEAGLAALAEGAVRTLEFGIQDEQAWSVGLACGGRIQILIEPLAVGTSRDDLLALNAAHIDKRAIVRAVNLSTGEAHIVDPDRDGTALWPIAADVIREGSSRLAVIDGQPWFFCLYNPPVDLVIVGAVHIGQPLSQIAAMTGFDVRVIDPRASFLTAQRFPGIALKLGFPDDVLGETPLVQRSAIVVLSHDPKIDDPAIAAALDSPAFYIGALGSRRTQTVRLERLKARGFSPEKLARIHGPVGLAIGAKTPEEIAISIMAEITAVLRNPAQSSV